MSHRAMIDGTAYEVTGGKTMVDGTVYSITGGKTLVDGTVYGIDFGSAEVPVSFSGKHTIYGDGRKGWIEITGKGTLTVTGTITADIYLLGRGGSGSSGKGIKITATGSWSGNGGSGGAGGKYLELYGQSLSGTYEASLTAGDPGGSKTLTGYNATLGDWTSYDGTSAASGAGKVTYSGNAGSTSDVKQITLTSTEKPSSGGAGRQPFTGHNPMSQGNAAKKLGSGGGAGGAERGIVTRESYVDSSTGETKHKNVYDTNLTFVSNASSGETSGAAGAGGIGGRLYVYQGSLSPNEGTPTYGLGKNGIIIVRWGY